MNALAFGLADCKEFYNAVVLAFPEIEWERQPVFGTQRVFVVSLDGYLQVSYWYTAREPTWVVTSTFKSTAACSLADLRVAHDLRQVKDA